jgi:hypothetical protein
VVAGYPSAATAALGARLQTLRAAAAASLGGSSNASSLPLQPSDVAAFVDEAVAAGQVGLAVDLLEAASELELATQGAAAAAAAVDARQQYVTSELLKRVLVVASFQQAVDAGDRVVALMLRSPGSRIDRRLLDLYANLVAGLAQPDHVRGVAFCNLMAELDPDAFGLYVAAVYRHHGPGGLAAALDFMASEALSFAAWHSVLRALRDAGAPSGALSTAYQRSLAAADREAIGALLPVGDGEGGSDTPTVARAQARVEAMRAAALGVFAEAMARRHQLHEAVNLLLSAIAPAGADRSAGAEFVSAAAAAASSEVHAAASVVCRELLATPIEDSNATDKLQRLVTFMAAARSAAAAPSAKLTTKVGSRLHLSST